MKRIAVNAGDRFGKLTVVSEVPATTNKWGKTPRRFSCLCDCGKSAEASLNELRRGNTKSCGCRKGRLTHGQAGSPEYRAWEAMKRRCSKSTYGAYSRYGGRGIKVCERWDNSFEAFFLDMGQKPSPKHSLERIDNDGDYCPGNCKWATTSEQGVNRSNNRRLTYEGRTMCLSEWAKELGVSTSSIHSRIRRRGEDGVISYFANKQKQSVPTC